MAWKRSTPPFFLPSVMALRSLDLFSGVGGLTLALKGLCEPVCFCEIEPAAQAVLRNQMRRGGLPEAPICPDVRKLTPNWLRQHKKSLPTSLVGGFPCTGFSLLGLRAGFDDDQSGLFMHILRLLDLFPSIQYLFLENVPQFLNVGMTRAAAELHTKRGFELRWCCCEAREVGAPQLRRRFFCVGVKAGAALPKAPQFTDGGYRPFAARWLKEPRRTVCTADASTAKSTARDAHVRASLLGNAVVPDCARHALLHLWSGALRYKPASSLSVMARKKWPKHGVVAQGHVFVTSAPAPRSFRSPVGVVLNGDLYALPRGYKGKNTLAALRGETRLDYWATPRAGLTTAAQIMSSRTAHDLPTQVRNAVDTPQAQRSCPVSPEFIEWLMGYKDGWTTGYKD